MNPTKLLPKTTFILLTLSLWLIAVTPGIAAQTLSRDSVSYGFATYLGSGIYSAGGQDVQIYQVPLSHEPLDVEDEPYGLKINIPLTFGFYNFDTGDIVNGDLPDSISTFSMVPGIQLTYPVTRKWHVSPFFDYGFAKNTKSDQTNTITAYGIKSSYWYNAEQFTLLLGNNLLYVKQYGDETGDTTDFASFETGLDFRFPEFNILKRHVADFSVYYANFRYFDSLQFLQPSERPVEVIVQNEVGFTFGVNIQKRYKYLDIPRIGLGIRTGNDVTIIRLVFGMPF